MTLRDRLRRLATPVSELDEENLRRFCASRPGVVPIADLQARHDASVVGEISSLRIVPHRDGTTWLEAVITDGTGSMVVMWTGRRRIAGVRPGQRLVVSGRPAQREPRGRLTVMNPHYQLL